MNARLLVLGVLHRGDFHPYEIKRRLEAALVECYIDVDVGTLYYAVRQLAKGGLIEEAAHERVARGGMRTIYRLTDAGRADFIHALNEEIEREGPVARTLYGPLLFLHLADESLVKAALQRKIGRLRDLAAKAGTVREQLSSRLSTGGRYLIDHIEQQRLLDLQWLERLLKEVEANGIEDVKDPSALAQA
jgi:DNA-binding PadR family transcriptional regulator